MLFQLLSAFLAVTSVLIALVILPTLNALGVRRPFVEVGNTDCNAVPELQACEKIVLHQPTGILYLACSDPERRTLWLPSMNKLNPAGSGSDYIATYDPRTSRVTRLSLSGSDMIRGLSTHGMDVVSSSHNQNELYLYLINHRPPVQKDLSDRGQRGPDSVIEIFKTTAGAKTLEYLTTVENPSVIITPNDVSGSTDGSSFYFTNDHSTKTGFMRWLDVFGYASGSIGYCHIHEGCKLAATGIHGANGITRAKNSTDIETYYVANSLRPDINVFERELDNTLVLVETISTDRPLDNLSVDADGEIWAAGIQNSLAMYWHIANPSLKSPSSALRIVSNKGEGLYYGEKYRVNKVFEDDGMLASGATSAVYDSERGFFFTHGVCSPQLTICRI